MLDVIIIQGIPGSGKSSWAKNVAEALDLMAKDVAIFSTDNHFMINGEYKFDFTKLSVAHQLNFKYFCNAIDKMVGVIIVDNTNLKIKDYKRYVEYAESNQYEVHFKRMPEITLEEALERNTHNVPADVLERFHATYKQMNA